MIIVLNFGSQFAHLIARRVRDLGVHSEILPYTITAKQIKALHPTGIILSGGPDSVNKKNSPRVKKELLRLGIPILGICYGQQLIAHQLGGRVKRGEYSEYGKEILRVNIKSQLFHGCDKNQIVWFSHGDQVVKLPNGFKKTGSTHTCKYACIEHRAKNIYAVQFHPEVTHTKHGKQILRNFVFGICQSSRDWRISSLRDTIISDLRARVGKHEEVLIAVSGGVDSLVVATLLRRAIGKRAHAVLINTGLLRKNEVQEVKSELKAIGMNWLKVHNASSIFLEKLQHVKDPEKKRKIIGHLFIKEFEKYIQSNLKQKNIVYLAQGTIYPDRIESAEPSKNTAKIKSHHNVTLPEKMHLQVLEPLRDLYKDEVRKLGRSLGLPKTLLYRHPFPGPGLAIRILGNITRERIRILREADAVYMEELKNAKVYHKIWQAFAALLPVRCVGVMGDARTYEYIITLRAVDSVDAMTADWHKIPDEVLTKISSRIINEVKGVNRIVYDITQKPPGTIEYE